MKVKICGITNHDDALYSVECGADAIGFIFYKKSKRYIEPRKAKEIIIKLPPLILSVGVFVNEQPEIVNQIAHQLKLNFIQLHGDENIDYINKIKYPVIKAFRVTSEFDWQTIDKFSNCIWLLDTYSSDQFGGTGKSFDWTTIPQNIRNRIILSGGIGIENLPTIINEIKPAAIDLSSSLELKPGKKDFNKIKNFFKNYETLRRQNC